MLDPSLRKEIDDETVKKEDRLKMEMQWERAKHSLQLEKLKVFNGTEIIWLF